MNKRSFLWILVMLTFLSGCKKDSTSPTTIDAKVRFTSDTFNDLYLWSDKMPSVDLTNFQTPQQYIDAVKYPQDRWSFSMSYSTLADLLFQGVTSGWGAGFALDANSKLWVSYVYTDSPAGKAGLQRGWQVKSINSVLVSSMSSTAINQALANTSATFMFFKNDGTELTLSIEKGAVVINSVLYAHVFTLANEKIGYLVYNEFINSSVGELNRVFSDFSAQNIKKMVLDLRYNGGGTTDSADSLVSLLVGKNHSGELYNRAIYSTRKSSMNFESRITSKPTSLALEQLVVVTTSETASASEMVIAGLLPYVNLKLVGTATHGKPVGMNIASNTVLDLAVAPISFRNVNANGYTDYFSGIKVDFEVNDRYSDNWGSTTDLGLAAGLNYLSTGSFGTSTQKGALFPPKLLFHGIDQSLQDCYK